MIISVDPGTLMNVAFNENSKVAATGLRIWKAFVFTVLKLLHNNKDVSNNDKLSVTVLFCLKVWYFLCEVLK